jgi:hypothetical protein
MWGVLRRFAVGAALCCVLAAVPGARAATGGIPSSEAFTFTGSLTYSWHGNPARGCARQRLCSVVGAITFRTDGSVQSVGGAARIYDVDATGTSTVRVRRGSLGAAGSGLGDCIDVATSSAVSLLLPKGSRGSAVSPGSLSSGRCAGPTPADLSRVRLPTRITGGRFRTVDFSGRRPFVAGPFSGELVSTLVLRPGGSSNESISSPSGGSSGSSGSTAPPVRRRTIEFVDLRYRVATLPGALLTAFAGTSTPFCELLDSCGLTGSLTVSTVPRAGTLSLDGVRVVRSRLGRARVLSDLLAGRLPLFASRVPFATVPFRISEMTERGGALDCGDALTPAATQFAVPTLSFDQHAPGTLTAGLVVPEVAPDSPTTDVLRTHCPGPASADIVGGSGRSTGYIARDVVPLRRFLDRHLTMSLRSGGSFRSAGYSGSRGGSIGLSLSLLSVRIGTKRVAA